MKLAKSTEYVSEALEFASSVAAGGGLIWIDGRTRQSCSQLSTNVASGQAFSTGSCCPFYHSFCEYNSELKSSFHLKLEKERFW
jgi:hypothetical protein